MEFGSIVCILKLNCGECLILVFCKVFVEGQLLVIKFVVKVELIIGDIEDMCIICEFFDDLMLVEVEFVVGDVNGFKKVVVVKKVKFNGQVKLMVFVFIKLLDKKIVEFEIFVLDNLNGKMIERVIEYVKLFLFKVVKKVVC